MSIEFCGGTHLTNTKEAEDFVIVEEAAVSKGVRRIVGVTRGEAKKCREKGEELAAAVERVEALSVDDEEVEGKVVALRKRPPVQSTSGFP